MSVKVRELRPGKWFVVIHYRGKRWSQLVGPDKSEADKYANELRREIEFRGIGALDRLKISEPSGITIARYGTSWVKEIERGKLKYSTKSSYRSTWEHHIKPDLGHLQLHEITYKRIKHWILDKMESTFTRSGEAHRYSRDSIRIMVATLRSILDEAVKDELIQANPVSRMGRLYGGVAKVRDDPDPFSLDELHELEAVCRDRWPMYYEFVLIQSRCGLRIGEAIGLQLRDVDFAEGKILIRRAVPVHGVMGSPKTSSSKRTVDMSPQLAGALEQMIRKRREGCLVKGKAEIPDWLFVNSSGHRLDYGSFTKVWNRLQMAAKIRRRRPHDLRHSYASLNLAAGKPLTFVSAQMGHKNPRITLEKYARWVKGADPGRLDVLDVHGNSTATDANTIMGVQNDRHK